jgi:cytoskeleton protein RodZ
MIHLSLQMLEFGASFKKAREARNLTIEGIAAETRISTRFLLAIESEQFDVLPGGVFNRGFIRKYAECIGKDPEEALRTYERLSRPVEIDSRLESQDRPQKKSSKPSVYYFAIAGLVIAVIAFYMLGHQRALPVQPVSAAIPPSVSPAPVSEPVPAEQAELSAAADPGTIAPTLPMSRPVPPAVTRSISVPVAQPKPEAPVVVELEFQENSWFKLSADGEPVVNGEILSRGASRRYTANQSMSLSIGNAAGVTLRVNGQQVSSLGRNGQVRMLNITPSTSAASLEE